MKILTVREFGRVAIGAAWSGAPPTITRRDVGALDQFQRAVGVEWFRIGHRELRATQWVGSFAVGTHIYEVLPKLDEPDVSGGAVSAIRPSVRRNLHLMLAAGGLLDFDDAGLAPLLREEKPLLPAYLEVFVRRLGLEWRRGALRRYQVMEENVPYLRGKLILRRQLSENVLHPERFACSRDEFTTDNPPARLLRAALRCCERQSFAPTAASGARALLAEMDEVADDPNVSRIPPPVPERQHQRFRPLLAMASLILGAESPSARNGGETVFALMFEMQTVFEAFIAAELRRALDREYRVLAQVGSRALLERESEGTWRGAFHLRPDAEIRVEDRASGHPLVCLIDTKWKRLDRSKPWNNVGQADIYQMHAYSTRYECPRTVLVYPRCDGFQLVADDYRRPGASVGEPHAKILVRTVNVSDDLRSTSVREKLRSDLRAIALAGA